MSRFNLSPEQKLVNTYGVLAYISKEERAAILSLSSGQFKPAIRSLEKQLKDAQKAEKKRQELALYAKPIAPHSPKKNAVAT